MGLTRALLLNHVIRKLEKMDMKLNELAASVVLINDQLLKARSEILDKIAALEASLGDVELPADAMVALENLRLSVQATDDIVPDAPVA